MPETIGFIEDAIIAWLEEELKAPPLARVEVKDLIHDNNGNPKARITVWKRKGPPSNVRLLKGWTPDLVFTIEPGSVQITCGYTRLQSTITISPDRVKMDRWASNRSYDLADPNLFTKLRADIYWIGKVLSMGAL